MMIWKRVCVCVCVHQIFCGSELAFCSLFDFAYMQNIN